MELLNGLSSAKIKDGKLILKNKDANIQADFSKAVVYSQENEIVTSPSSNNFYDTKWIVSSITGLDSLGQNELYIILSQEELSAFTGINQIMAPFGYNSEDNSIYIGEGATTLALGSDEENQIEANFLQNLYNSQKIELDKNTLLLKDANDNILITLTK
jgi:heat shock protein HslJ